MDGPVTCVKCVVKSVTVLQDLDIAVKLYELSMRLHVYWVVQYVKYVLSVHYLAVASLQE